MDTDQEQAAPEADDSSEQSGSPAQTVRVPNVSPGAKSGLDHIVIGSDALASSDEATTDDAAGDGPELDLDAKLAWVGEAEDFDTAKARADEVWAELGGAEQSDPAVDYDELGGKLHTVVYGKKPTEPTATVPATTVESDTAGTGDATNTETGVTTPGGEPLPAIEQADGDPLVPAGLSGDELDAWVSGDAVEGDETENPERYAAYQQRVEAARIARAGDPAATDADED